MTVDVAGGSSKVMLARYSAGGRRAWLRTWQSASGTMTQVRDFVVAGAGHVVVAGVVLKGTPDELACLASWTARGELRWARTCWRKATGEPAAFNALAIDGKGRIWAAGSVGTPNSTQDALLMRHSASGSRRWTQTFDGGDHQDDWFSVLVPWEARRGSPAA